MEKIYKYLTDKEAEAVDLLVNNLRMNLNKQLLRIQLFDSKSRGDFKPDSDIDILVVLKQRTEEILEKISEIHLDVELRYDVSISLIIFSEYEYKQNEVLETLLTKNVMKDGILL